MTEKLIPVDKCRVCGNAFFNDSLLHYHAMPAGAQSLPDKSGIRDDRPVDIEVCQCSGCGLVQLSNQPVPYYRDVIRAAAFSEEMRKFRIRQFSNFVKKYSLENKKIIEVGCGRGEYLELMMQCGAEAYGLEHAAAAVDFCTARQLKVQQGFIDSDSYRLARTPFDAFFILNFLEHIPLPNQLLRGIHNNLDDNAVGLVEVPNFDMIMRNRLFSEFIGDHLCYFTRRTLETCLEINGFEVVECRETWYDYIISAVVRKRRSVDLSRFHQIREQLASELESFISRFPAMKTAIWGAGHQALAVVALTGIGNKIAYVVDSATFKQGRFTPASHVPIVAPDTLESNPVDAVIVMAASYSDEVAGIIRSRYGKQMDIAVLRDFGLEELNVT